MTAQTPSFEWFISCFVTAAHGSICLKTARAWNAVALLNLGSKLRIANMSINQGSKSFPGESKDAIFIFSFQTFFLYYSVLVCSHVGYWCILCHPCDQKSSDQVMKPCHLEVHCWMYIGFCSSVVENVWNGKTRSRLDLKWWPTVASQLFASANCTLD